jgi:hypothetical protein
MLTLALLAVGASCTFSFYHQHFSLDDAAIYQRLVKNIAFHGQYTYNLDQPVNPGTSTLYPLVLSAAALAFPRTALQSLAVSLDTVMLAIASFALMNFMWRISRSVLVVSVASLSVFFLPLSQLLGMEASMLIMFLSLYIDRFKHASFRLVLVALFPLVRPEGIVFLAVEGLYAWLRAGLQLSALPQLTLRMALLCCPVIITCAANMVSFGEILPHSVGNKVAQGVGGGWQTYRSFLKGLALGALQSTNSIMLLVCTALGAAYGVWKRSAEVWAFVLAISLWQVGLVISKAAYYTWYALPLYYALFFTACLGAAALEGLLRGVFGAKRTTVVSCCLAIAFLFWSASHLFPQTPLEPESRQAAQIKVAQTIARVHKGALTRVAALEVGHLGNALDEAQFSIYDLCGLTSKNKGFFQPGFYDQFFCHDRPEYLVINHLTENHPAGTPIVSQGDQYTLTTYPAADYHRSVWPHHVGLVLDPRFHKAYEFLEFMTSAGYPGGFSLFRLRTSFVCDKPAVTVKNVTASREHDPSVAANKVIDGDGATIWNAGDGQTQWLRFSFAEMTSIGRVHLLANRDREYEFTLRLRFRDTNGTLLRSLESQVKVSDGDLLELVLEDPVEAQTVEVESVHGRNWVAWREIQFF